jgi:hypothetical protein
MPVRVKRAAALGALVGSAIGTIVGLVWLRRSKKGVDLDTGCEETEENGLEIEAIVVEEPVAMGTSLGMSRTIARKAVKAPGGMSNKAVVLV